MTNSTVIGEWRERAGDKWCPAKLNEIHSIAENLLRNGARFVSLVVTQIATGHLRLVWYWDLKGKLFSAESVVMPDTPVPSIVDIYCGADWAEREAREYYAVTFEGRASTPPLMLREGDPVGLLLRSGGDHP